MCTREIGLTLIFLNGCLLTAIYLFYLLFFKTKQIRDDFVKDGMLNMILLKSRKLNKNPVIGHVFKMNKKEFLNAK